MLLDWTPSHNSGYAKTINLQYSTDFFYPPITANLEFDIYFNIPEIPEQTLPHQWRLIYN